MEMAEQMQGEQLGMGLRFFLHWSGQDMALLLFLDLPMPAVRALFQYQKLRLLLTKAKSAMPAVGCAVVRAATSVKAPLKGLTTVGGS